MIVKEISTGRKMPCTKIVWNKFTKEQRAKFEIVQDDDEVKILKSLRDTKK